MGAFIIAEEANVNIIPTIIYTNNFLKDKTVKYKFLKEIEINDEQDYEDYTKLAYTMMKAKF